MYIKFNIYFESNIINVKFIVINFLMYIMHYRDSR